MVEIKINDGEYTKYEIARMIGSRALQISMGAPFLIKLTPKRIEELRYNPVEIAKLEFKEGVLPITVKRILPHERRG
ncbi:MAG: DNA-directed RNA polymerase subunit K [Nanoarchaeota archaeon]|nr:DNA-directed RNA polymerase subunit K [Nanoarchaeota archaeon]MBU1269646.1 DNA-directed RNA polymerase subunit K [Nanoarchaeota archaeon]MBU1605079.1 DNA-directed RNA polymerase subunit K [Nanoarchaeota archaeon]MBU2443231.1 DNA-directed RNA polymerase subunit K [Nanoarchaeota archaeon]